MMPRISFLVLLTALSLPASGRADPPVPGQTNADAKRIQKLIQELGSDEFAVREKATRQLEAIGTPALEPLRQAAKSDDLEIRRTAEELVVKVQAQSMNSAMLAPRKVSLDLKDVAVPEAVALLARQSGYALQLTGDQAGLAQKKITLQARELPFWETLQQLCQQAGLTQYRPAPGAARGEVLQLTRGKGSELASSLTGSVRLAILPAAQAQVRAAALKKGEAVLILEATPEPRLKGFGLIGLVRVERALDDQGQALPVVGLAEAAMGHQDFLKGAGGLVIGGRRLAPEIERVSGLRQAVLRIPQGEKPARVIRELSGVLPVQAYRDLEEDLVVVNNILKADGTKTKGKKGEEIEIQRVIRRPNGEVQIVALLRGLGGPQPNMPIGINIQGNVVIQGNVMIGGVRFDPLEAARLPRLLDTEGRPYQLADIPGQAFHLNNGTIAHQVNLVFRPGAGQKEPARLVLRGQQMVTFEVPFTLKNIPLP